MIFEAKKAGCDCVKFQSWTSDTLYSKTYYEENPIAKRFINGFSFSKAQLESLVEYSRECEISFSSTPYSKEEVDFLVNECSVPFVKVASMDLNNHYFLNYIGQTGVPIVLSTGMGDFNEIESAITTLENTGNKNICILHCVSIYPPEISSIRLNNIAGLRSKFSNYPVGFSDHSLGFEIPSAAVALGACLIEKHFTLDKSRIGMDNQMAMEPDEMISLVNSCHNVYQSLGTDERILQSEEIKKRKEMRRSIVSSKFLKAGTKLIQSDFDFKRPGTGLEPNKASELIGRILKKDLDKDSFICFEDVH